MKLSSKSLGVLIGASITTGIIITGNMISSSIDKSTNQLAELSIEIFNQSKELSAVDHRLSELSDRVDLSESRIDRLETVKQEARVSFIKSESGLPDETVNEIIKQSDSKSNVDDTLILAISYTESSFDPKAVNTSSGATGLTQFLPESAEWVASQHGLPYNYDMLYDPTYSVKLSAIYVEDLANEHGLYRALSKYGGEVDTTEYADKVWSRYMNYENKKTQYINEYVKSHGYDI